MKFHLLGLVLLGSLLLIVDAEPVPKPVQVIGRRSSYFNEPAKFRSANVDKDVHLIAAEVDGDVVADMTDDKATPNNGNQDASSGRLFMKKLLLFKNMFSSNSQQPVVIITGAGTGTGTSTTNPTTTVTSTGTIPSATGTVTTSPTTTGTGTGTGTGTTGTASRTNDEEEAAAYGGTDEEALQAAIAAGAQEYIVTGEPIQGTGSPAAENEEAAATDMSKASRQPARINLRRKGSRRGQGQVISVRVPARYRRYFKNGQKVMLNTNNRPGKRRVIRKRVQTNRRRGNKNKKNKNKGKGKGGKRTRITAA